MQLTVDLETYWDDLYSLRKMSMLDYITDTRFKVQMLGVAVDDGPPAILAPDAISQWLHSLRQAHDHIELIGQNTQFDALILTHHYGFKADVYRDTKCMARALNVHESSSLAALAERLWPDDPTMRKGDELASSKGVVDFDPELFNSIARYCLQDVTLTRAAYHKMLADGFPPNELPIIDMVTRWCVEPTFVLDEELMGRYIPYLETERQQIIAASQLWRFAHTYNPDSKQRPQFLKEFESELRKGNVRPEDREYWLSLKVLGSNKAFSAFLRSGGISPPTKLNPKGQVTLALAKNDPEFLLLEKAHPKLAHVWNARRSAKSTQALTRARRFVETARRFGGRMPVPLAYNQAHTGRLGGTEGLNMQNLTRNADPSHPAGDLRPGALRRALRAPPGYVVPVGDLSNIEARMLAYQADHEVLLDIFANGGDPYCWMAGDIYMRPVIKDKDKLERNVGKATVLGCGFGMGVDRFTEYMHSGPMGMAPIRFEDPQMYARIISQYRNSNKPIVSYWSLGGTFLEMMYQLKPGQSYAYKMLVIEHRRIRLPSGLYLNYPNLRPTERGWVYDSREEGVETYIYGAKLVENLTQALANCVIKEAMTRIDTAFRERGWGGIVLQVHDEIVTIVQESVADRATKLMEELLTVVPDWAPGLPVAAECGYAHNYSK